MISILKQFNKKYCCFLIKCVKFASETNETNLLRTFVLPALFNIKNKYNYEKVYLYSMSVGL